MLKWAISFAINRMLILVVIMVVIRAYGSTSCHAGGPLEEWIERTLPFDQISRALR